MTELDRLVLTIQARRAHTDDLCDLIGEMVADIKAASGQARRSDWPDAEAREGGAPGHLPGLCDSGVGVEAAPRPPTKPSSLRLTRRGRRLRTALCRTAIVLAIWLAYQWVSIPVDFWVRP